MRHITRFEATQYSIEELQGLLRDLFNTLAHLSQDNLDYRTTLKAIETVQTELRARSPSP